MSLLFLSGFQLIISSLNALTEEPCLISMKLETTSNSRTWKPLKKTYIPKKDPISELHKLSHTCLPISAKSKQFRISENKRYLPSPTILPKLHPQPITNIIQNITGNRRPSPTNIFPKTNTIWTRHQKLDRNTSHPIHIHISPLSLASKEHPFQAQISVATSQLRWDQQIQP